jgi:hypothetical protein
LPYWADLEIHHAIDAMHLKKNMFGNTIVLLLKIPDKIKYLYLPDGETVEEQTIKRLAVGPSSQVTSWQRYDINGYLFYTIINDQKTISQNSGVRI